MMTEEHKRKIGKANSKIMKEKWKDPIFRQKMSLAHKGKTPVSYWLLHTPEAIKKMALSQKRRFADKTKHPRFKHGKSHTKEYAVMYENKRRVLKKKANGFHTAEQWIELKKMFNNECLCCHKKEPEIKLTQDHIVPLTKGGTDFIWNIQPLCSSCNAKKRQRTISYLSGVYKK